MKEKERQHLNYRKDITKEWREIKNKLNALDRYTRYIDRDVVVLSEAGCANFMKHMNEFKLYQE